MTKKEWERRKWREDGEGEACDRRRKREIKNGAKEKGEKSRTKVDERTRWRSHGREGKNGKEWEREREKDNEEGEGGKAGKRDREMDGVFPK